MIRKLLNKIENNRSSKETFWKLSIAIKDSVWSVYYLIFYKMRNPPEPVFEKIYKEKVWGGNEDFFSGDGSLSKNTSKYINYINKFLRVKKIKKVVDLGCGDFRVGKKIQWNKAKYTGVDIVEPLINRNNKLYSNKNVKFIKKNIIKDLLPEADLCLIKEVLQHLNNNDIKKILKKIKKYRYALITNCIPKNLEKKINLNILRGEGRKFGLHLEMPPFNQQVKTVLSYPKKNKIEIMQMVLIESDNS
jgi:SAM-dependent methyltransferase